MISKIWAQCVNKDKHTGTSRYWICWRCKIGEFKTKCGGFKKKPDAPEEREIRFKNKEDQMTKKSIAELVKICSYPELQKLWRPKVGDEFYDRRSKEIKVVSYSEYSDYKWGSFDTNIDIWLPRIEDAIELMGKGFTCLEKNKDEYRAGWEENHNHYINGWHSFARIACLRALRETLKGG